MLNENTHLGGIAIFSSFSVATVQMYFCSQLIEKLSFLASPGAPGVL